MHESIVAIGGVNILNQVEADSLGKIFEQPVHFLVGGVSHFECCLSCKFIQVNNLCGVFRPNQKRVLFQTFIDVLTEQSFVDLVKACFYPHWFVIELVQ